MRVLSAEEASSSAESTRKKFISSAIGDCHDLSKKVAPLLGKAPPLFQKVAPLLGKLQLRFWGKKAPPLSPKAEQLSVAFTFLSAVNAAEFFLSRLKSGEKRLTVFGSVTHFFSVLQKLCSVL